MDDVSILGLFQLTPKEAVEFLQGRGDLVASYNWQDVWQEEHTRQFTVSRLTNLDVLESLRDSITQSVQGDLSRRDWNKNARAVLADAGWWGKKELIDPQTGKTVTTTFDPARLKLIYDTNTRTAYSAGLFERIERNKRTHPFIRYITKRDERVRASHRAWDNITLPVDHPFWDTHIPPNGWRCRCRVIGVSQRDYDKGVAPNGEPLKKTAPSTETRTWVNKRTGEVSQVPVGIDPGFGHNPGRARMANMATVQADKIASASASLGAAAAAIMTPGEQAARHAAWGDFIEAARAENRPTGLSEVLGFIDAATLAWLAARERLPQTAGVVVQDKLLIGPKAARHGTAGDALTTGEWQSLAEKFDGAERVLWDKRNETLVVVVDSLTDPRKIKIAVALDFFIKTSAGKRQVNSVRTVFKVDAVTLEDGNIYEVVK
ncbi:MAG: hypothetical protein CVV15_06520 [Gammaproteobacteria bacterium HGW-Gammaproteobacteria-5]|nr:MAG: hypothetical protein CVV15_06520 [Gammaproteobacteria bacterium HGW-Gammaproteobacteria-5]